MRTIKFLFFTCLVILSLSSFAQKASYPETYQCGTYRLSGKLKYSTEDSSFYLWLYPGTRNEYRVKLLGKKIKLLSYNKGYIQIEGNIQETKRGNKAVFKVLKLDSSSPFESQAKPRQINSCKK